jgi:alkanesulfonate monooxygenase SsuD/methylene tetrahydromethanopterin reductase-like flavin-dependent oxidoreductase (luciferase family)
MPTVDGPLIKRTGPGEIEELDAKPPDESPVFSGNPLKLGVFGMNASYGIIRSHAETSFEPSYAHNVAIARKTDELGLEMMVPLGRWKGFGGTTDNHGQNLETYTWASAMSQHTEYPTIFSTSHVPTIHPLVAAKQSTTIDHVSEGRFALNIVSGWFSPEMEMFGGKQLEHDERYERTHEWTELLKTFWTEQGFEFDGEFYQVEKNEEVDESMRGEHYVSGGYMRPKPIQQPRPPVMSAGQSEAGRDFAATHADLSFFSMTGLDQGAEFVEDMEERAAEKGRDRNDMNVISFGLCCIADTEADAQAEYDEIVEKADWESANNMIDLVGIESETFDDPQNELAERFVTGDGSMPLVGTPAQVADDLIAIHEAGIGGYLL